MPIDASPAGTLDIENATLRSREIVALTNMVAGNDVVRSGGPALEVYGDPSNGGNEATLQLVSNTANTISTSFTSLTSNAGVLSVKTGTDASDNGTITFGGFQNERLRITSDGKVGVGTDDPISSLQVKVPSSSSLVWGTTITNPYNGATTTQGIGLKLQMDGSATWYGDDKWCGIAAKAEGNYSDELGLAFYTQGTIGSDPGNAPTEKMRIKHNGNVGIGYSNPLGKLYIAADYNHTLQRPSTNSNHYLVLSKTGAQVVDEGPGISFCGSYHDTNDYQDVMAEIRGICDTGGGRRGRLEFWTSSSDGINDVDTQAMTIKSNGNVGVGTNNPYSYQLVAPGRVCLGQLGLAHREGSSTSLKQVSHSNGSDRVFQFKLNSTSSWTPGFFKIKAAVVNNNGGQGFAWGWEAGFKVLDGGTSVDLLTTISGSNPGSSWFSITWDGTNRILTLTAKDNARQKIVAECEVVFNGGIQDA